MGAYIVWTTRARRPLFELSGGLNSVGICSDYRSMIPGSKVYHQIFVKITYRVFRKNCVFFHNSLQPLPRLHRCKRPSKLSNAIRVYSHSYWLVIFCTTNSSRVLARERWQIFENSWKKTQYLMNTCI